MDRASLERILPVLSEKYKFRLEILEKDYYITIILNAIESHLTNNIIFKGGTLLNKIYLDYRRLSEDIDFTYFGKEEELNTRLKSSKAINPIKEKMKEFLNYLDLESTNPEGQGFNNSTQYIFEILYPSFITGKDESIKIEISLRQFPLDKPVYNTIKHFYKNPFTDENLIPENKILSLSLNETVAEKLKAAITRKDLAIRDYYDLWYISERKFSFNNKHFMSIFKKKLEYENYKGDYSYNFGLNKESIELLKNQIKTNLLPVTRVGEDFNLEKVFDRFNVILKT